MKKSIQILTGVLVVQILIIVFVYWPRGGTGAGESVALLPEFNAASVNSFTIEDGDGNHIRLAKVGGAWVLTEVDDFPCKGESIDAFLTKLSTITLGQPVTRTEESHAKLQVAARDFARKVTLETQGAESVFFLGSSPSYGATHIRLEGQSETYLTSVLQSYEVNANAASWVDTSYFNIAQSDIVSLSLRNGDGSLQLIKDDQGNWGMPTLAEGELLDETQVDTLISRATSITMMRPLGMEKLPSYGMEEPLAVVTIGTNEGTYTLQVGAKDPDENSYVLKSSESPYYVVVSEYAAGTFVTTASENLLLPTPTSTESEAGEVPEQTPSPES
jgi:hypothetical protein